MYRRSGQPTFPYEWEQIHEQLPIPITKELLTVDTAREGKSVFIRAVVPVNHALVESRTYMHIWEATIWTHWVI